MKTARLGILILVLSLTFALILGAQTPTQPNSKRLAVVDGEAITEAQVQDAAARELNDLEMRRLQFEAGQAHDRSNAIETALNDLVGEKVVAAEAKKRSVTPEQLLSAEVDAKIPVPSDEAVDRFWNANQSRINMTRDQALPQIREYLRGQDRDRVLSSFIEQLKKDHGVESYFDPFRNEIAVQGYPSRGPDLAAVTIVEFSDFECPFCGALYPTLKEVEQNYKDKLRIVYRQFPLTGIHPTAQKAAEASLCANEQQHFWEMHDAMFTDQKNLSVDALKQKAARLNLNTTQFNTCLDSGKYVDAIRKDILEGTKAGVSGTPAIFVNGRFLSGAQPYQEIAKVIDEEISRAVKK